MLTNPQFFFRSQILLASIPLVEPGRPPASEPGLSRPLTLVPKLRALLLWGAVAVTFSFASPLSAQTVLVSYNGTAVTPSTVGAGVTAGNLTSHGSVTFTVGDNFPGKDKGYATLGWPTGSTPPVFNLNSISFALTAGPDEPVELTSVEMWFKSLGNGPDQVKLRLTLSDNLNPFNDTVASGVLALSDSSAYQFVRTNTSGSPIILQPNQTARFFIVGFDYKATGSSDFLITDIQVSGAAIPEPTTSALVLIALVVGAGAVRRRAALRQDKSL